MAGKGILLNNDNDLNVLNGALLVNDSLMQEVGLIIQMHQGGQKAVPLLGPNLIQLKKINVSRFSMEQRLRIHLAIDKKNYKEVKKQIEALLTTI